MHEHYTKQRSWVWRVIHELCVLSTLYYWIQSIAAYQRYPGGDGPHILGTSGRLAQLLRDGEFEWFVYCFSSLLGPHPPFAYLPFVGSALVFPDLPHNHLIGGAVVLWLIADAMYRMGAGIIGFAFIWVWTPIWLQSENAGIDLVAAATVIEYQSPHTIKCSGKSIPYVGMGCLDWCCIYDQIHSPNVSMGTLFGRWYLGAQTQTNEANI